VSLGKSEAISHLNVPFDVGEGAVEKAEQRTESAFSKACTYLNYNKTARRISLLAAIGSGLMGILMLCVLWLFVDYLVWHGRVPDLHELSPRQRDWLARTWERLDYEGKSALLNPMDLSPQEKTRLTDPKLTFEALPRPDQEALWERMAHQILSERIGPEAAEQVFREDRKTRSKLALNDGDNGILSLVVREVATDRLWTPVPMLASWNVWMWNGYTETPALFPSFLNGLLLLAIILALAWVLLMVLNREMAAVATIEATNRLRRAVYHHTFRLGTLAIRALGPSEAVSLLTRHVEAVHDALYTYLTVSCCEPILIGMLLVFSFLINPLLSIAFLLFAIVIWLLGNRLLASIRKQVQQANDIAAERLTIIRESLMLMRLVKSYQMEQFNQVRMERQLARYAETQRVRHRGESLGQPVLLLLVGLGLFVLLYVATLMSLYGYLTAAGVAVLVTTLVCLYRPTASWLESRKLLRRGREAAELIFNFLERKSEVGQVVGAEFLPPLSSQIEFDDVTLRDAASNRTLLENVTLTIKAGERVGLVGADELEKHAFVYLLPRLLDPTSGEIRIDDHNLRWVTLDSLRTQIGMVMMQNLVFHDTVRNNIGCGDSLYTLPQIIEAAKIAHAHQFIQKLPQGYETPLGELGHSLSLSEQYRIALARAILRDPALLIIEEPDTDLDDATKDLIDDTMSRVLPGRTVIFLPHRISTLKTCSRIYLINRGRVVASGTHKELLSTSKLYRHLHYLEFNQMDEES
jgi:ATP-binding cassette subfamily B protein